LPQIFPVFVGGEDDIKSVCRNDATCAGIDRCFRVEGGELCRFRFVIYLSEQAAKTHAEITSKLGLNVTDSGRYLDKKLDLYLDDKLVDSLFISEDLKGKETTQIQIQGSGPGATRAEAATEAQKQMNKLQTVLITGSLPFKLEIIKLDTISPLLGERFLFTVLIAGLSAIIGVGIIILIRYKSLKLSMALLLTLVSEIIIILGFASMINWNLDLASIAGILAVIGTGVDQQIVILDESRLGKTYSMKERLKRALFVIISAYFTSLVSLLPLYWAGAGLLKGFAVTTIIGITSAVLITRPAFADIVKKIEG
jgi:preprotein translocase subunit SecD